MIKIVYRKNEWLVFFDAYSTPTEPQVRLKSINELLKWVRSFAHIQVMETYDE